jgi:hypothetical protein
MSSTKKKVASVAFTGATAAAAMGVNAAPAYAASHWTITPGGAFTAVNAPGTATLLGVQISPSTSLVLQCPVAAATGDLTGTSQSGTPVALGAINTATFGTVQSPCSVSGLQFVAAIDSPVTLTGVSETSGVTTGAINGNPTINATITGVNGFDCVAKVSGTTVPGQFVNADNALALNAGQDATLQIKSAVSCLGILQPGQPAWFAATYNPDPPQTVDHA